MLGRRRRHPPPRVKWLVDALYQQLVAGGIQGYGEALLHEYGQPGEVITHLGLGNGMVSLITWPARAGEPERLTHLVYGGCTPTEVRADLLARGLGGLAVVEVHPPDADLEEDEEDEAAYDD
ncbi:hypothetical protein [Gandjariella thermophila]|uniref:Uncharacterized protein n=1 Tax=Gandjariella thermophila TaxID=1931992 RepID=A0A4D4JCW3_9PSEU|nr:hypothetical protein [Gandjariella thermophila]GDY32236.1 hypothetical protein GTS_38690 [Gandjariella thermophila]